MIYSPVVVLRQGLDGALALHERQKLLVLGLRPIADVDGVGLAEGHVVLHPRSHAARQLVQAAMAHAHGAGLRPERDPEGGVDEALLGVLGDYAGASATRPIKSQQKQINRKIFQNISTFSGAIFFLNKRVQNT